MRGSTSRKCSAMCAFVALTWNSWAALRTAATAARAVWAHTQRFAGSGRWSWPSLGNKSNILVCLKCRHSWLNSGAAPGNCNITDSQVSFHCFTKGRSSSPRLNRLLRRVNALSLMSDSLPVHPWTISKWNEADRPSRMFRSHAAAWTPQDSRDLIANIGHLSAGSFALFAYLECEGMALAQSYGKLDQQLADYINHLFQEGETLTEAGWLPNRLN